MLTNAQRETLLRPLKPQRVNQKQGMSYLEAYDVIAHLTRIFGYEGWDKQVIHLGVLFETEGKSKDGSKAVWTVAYRCDMRLIVKDPEGNVIKETDDSSTGEAINQPSRGDAHDLAMKSAVSGALKRCAKDLGDQFGLGLYDGGSIEACVKRVVIYPEIAGGDPPLATGHTPAEEVRGELPADTPANGVAAGQRPSASDPEEDLSMMTTRQKGQIFAIINAHQLGDRHKLATEILGRKVESFTTITGIEADRFIAGLNKKAADVALAVQQDR